MQGDKEQGGFDHPEDVTVPDTFPGEWNHCKSGSIHSTLGSLARGDSSLNQQPSHSTSSNDPWLIDPRMSRKSFEPIAMITRILADLTRFSFVIGLTAAMMWFAAWAVMGMVASID